MIVQCDECNAKFRLDDAKVKDEGVKVRCSKCKHVFLVRKEEPVEEPDIDSLLSGLETKPSGAEGTKAVVTSIAGEGKESDTTADAGKPEAWEMDFEGSPQGISSGQGVRGTELGMGWQLEGDLQGGTVEESKAASVPHASQDKGQEFFAKVGKEEPDGNEFDLGEFNFGEDQEQSADTSSFEKTVKLGDDPVAGGTEGKEEPSPPFDDFAATVFMEKESGRPAEEGPAEEFSFDDTEWEKEALPGIGDEPLAAPTGEIPAPSPIEAADSSDAVPAKKTGDAEPFDFGMLDFGDTQPADHAEAEQEQPQIKTASQSAGTFFETEQTVGVAPSVASFPEEEELPPSSALTTRRKERHSLAIVIISICLVLILALVGGGYYFFTAGPAAFSNLGLGFVAKWLGHEGGEEGKITVGNPAGAFLINREAGEIFVISGDAVNNFRKPRASIQVRATLYGAKGVTLQQKTAYAGNALSKEQLTTLPFAKIEAAMNNQFGDSLANLGVQPGKSIPFAVVFDKVPKEVVEYAVEVVGSTVASQ